MRNAKNKGVQKDANAISVLELSKQVSVAAACLGFAYEDKDTPPWARQLIKAALGYFKPGSRKMKEGFAEDFVGRVAIIKAVMVAVKKYCKPAHKRKAQALVTEGVGQTKRPRA